MDIRTSLFRRFDRCRMDKQCYVKFREWTENILCKTIQKYLHCFRFFTGIVLSSSEHFSKKKNPFGIIFYSYCISVIRKLYNFDWQNIHAREHKTILFETFNFISFKKMWNWITISLLGCVHFTIDSFDFFLEKKTERNSNRFFFSIDKRCNKWQQRKKTVRQTIKKKSTHDNKHSTRMKWENMNFHRLHHHQTTFISFCIFRCRLAGASS